MENMMESLCTQSAHFKHIKAHRNKRENDQYEAMHRDKIDKQMWHRQPKN